MDSLVCRCNSVDGERKFKYSSYMTKLPISLCIITLNEEQNLPRCMESAAFVSEIVVLDSGSTDQTRTLAQEYGARVFNEEWRGYGRQKQRAVELAENDWVLCLDADEELSAELQVEIQSLFKRGEPPAIGFRSPRKTFHLGRWIYHGGWYPNYQTRLFHRKKLQWSEEDLHESVKGQGLGELNGEINHYPYQNLFEHAQTENQYSTISSQILFEKGRSFYIFDLFVKPFVKFIEIYIVKRGFLEGTRGLIIAFMGAYSKFLVFAKLWEKEHLGRSTRKNRSL